jgi:hypothetical protein
MAWLICEICYTAIGQFDPFKISQPLTGAMFTSPRPLRELPPPFGPAQVWPDLACGVCRKRPIIQPDRIMTEYPRCHETVGAGPTYIGVPLQAATPQQGKPLFEVFDDAPGPEPDFKALALEIDSATSPTSDDLDAGNTEACTENEPVAPIIDDGDDRCPGCGRGASTFKSSSGYVSHMRHCTAKAEAE